MTTALALARTDVPDSIAEMMQVARFLEDAGDLLPRHLRGQPSALFAVMLKARALDIQMSMAFEHIILIEGKPGMSAVLMQSLVNRAGHTLYPVEDECNNTVATVRAVRPGISKTGEQFVRFTIEEAHHAGLFKLNESGEIRARSFKKPDQPMPWEAWTADMLVARAISRASRRYFADVLLGMVYTPDEVGAEVDEEGKPVRRDSIRVDLPAEVKKYILLIRHSSTVLELRKVYDEIAEVDLLEELTLDGLTLKQAVSQRKAYLEELARRASATADEQPAADAGPPVTTAEEVGPGDDEAGYPAAPAAEQPQAQDSSTAALISEPPAENPESDFDQLAAAPAEPDAAADTADTPRRRAVLEYLSKSYGGDADRAERAAVDHFQIPLDSIGTHALQTWLTPSNRKESN